MKTEQDKKNEKVIPTEGKQSLKEQAINKKGNLSDGAQINQQVKQKKENHEPRDNA